MTTSYCMLDLFDAVFSTIMRADQLGPLELRLIFRGDGTAWVQRAESQESCHEDA